MPLLQSVATDLQSDASVATKAEPPSAYGSPSQAHVAQPKHESATPPNVRQELESKLNVLRDAGNYREFIDIERQKGAFPKATRHESVSSDHHITSDVTVWCNNDYLNMGQHPQVVESMISAVENSGCGAGGTRNISGTTHYVTELEKNLADLHDKEAALVFSSGYVANEAALSTLPQLLSEKTQEGKDNPCHIISDSLNHA